MLHLQLQEVEAMNTGKKIKLIWTFRGLTQKELGEACGIHEVAIRKYELGKNIPKPEQLRKIAEALNVNVNSLAEPLKAKGVSLAFVYYHYYLQLMKSLMCLSKTLMASREYFSLIRILYSS